MQTRIEKEKYIENIIKNEPKISINNIQKRLLGTEYGIRRQTLQEIVSDIRGKWKHTTIPLRKFKPGKRKKLQMHLWGYFLNEKTGEIRKMDGWSTVHEKHDRTEMIDEAANEAKSKLGGTNWILVKIITIKYIFWYKK